MPLLPILVSFAAVAAGVAIDQYIKMLVLAQLQPLGRVEVIPGLFQLIYVENRGAAFGILANYQWLFIVLTSVICLAMAASLIWYKHHTGLTRTAATLIIAGGLGNLIDRVRLNFVVDYLHVEFFPPVFNFADICVTVGCGLMVLYVVLFADHNGRPKKGRKYAKYANYTHRS